MKSRTRLRIVVLFLHHKSTNTRIRHWYVPKLPKFPLASKSFHLDFRLSSGFKYRMRSFGYIPGVHTSYLLPALEDGTDRGF